MSLEGLAKEHQGLTIPRLVHRVISKRHTAASKGSALPASLREALRAGMRGGPSRTGGSEEHI
jgi:hypothetical protein